MSVLRLLLLILVLLPFASSAQFEFIEDLTPEGGDIEDFGLGAEIFGDELFVAWPHGFGDPDPALSCGEVYYYKKNDQGRFELLSILQAPVCTPGDMFGASTMALQDDTLVIPALAGLRGDGQGNPADSRVWIFERDASHNPGGVNAGWRPVTDLIGSSVGGNRAMGGRVQIEGDTLAVQSHVVESVFGFSFVRADGVYIFRRNGDSWSEITRITEPTDFFGLDFRLTPDQLIVGAPEAQSYGGAGKVLVYDRNGDDFTLRQTLTAGPEGNFGYFLDTSGDRLAVGAVNLALPGAVFLFDRAANGDWEPAGKLTPPTRADNDIYGVAGRFADDLLIIGAENGVRQSEPAVGKVFVYQQIGDNFELIQELVAPVASNASDVFGGALVTNGTDLLVKAFGSPAGGFTAFYHFQRESGPDTGEPFSISLGHSGLFYDPTRDGEGFLVDTLPDGRGLMFWFTYDQGEPMWLLAIGPIEDNTMLLNEVFVTSGPRFDAFEPAELQLVNWGSMVFEFDDCDNGRVHYFSDLGFADDTIELTRLSNIAGIRCGQTEGLISNGFSGGFFNPERNGEGLQVHITDLDGEHTPVVYWPTYDTQGNQLWLYGMGHTDGDSIVIDNMMRFDGADFGELFSSEDVQGTTWGEVRIDYTGCDQLSIDYTSVDPAFGSGSVAMQRLYQLGQTTCNGAPSAP